jgi:D-alanyl-D-alanine carboxypeptidase
MALLTDKQIIEKYGQPGNPDNFTIMPLPYPMRIAWDTKTQVRKMQCHEDAEQKFLNVFNLLLAHYGLEKIQALGIDLFGGCVNVRTMRGSKTRWSRHAWGICIDLDPARNGLKTPWLSSQFAKREYKPMIDIFYANDFINYGIELNKDAMHFELVK